MRILALDIARKCGWASLAGGEVESGVRTLVGENPGRALVAADGAFQSLIALWNPLVIYVEMPFTARAADRAARLQFGFHGLIHLYAFRHGIPIREVAAMTVKKHWTGSGKAKKADMVAEATARGFDVADDNEADALAVLSWAISVEGCGDPSWPICKRTGVLV